jgi:hypothetical protein
VRVDAGIDPPADVGFKVSNARPTTAPSTETSSRAGRFVCTAIGRGGYNVATAA